MKTIAILLLVASLGANVTLLLKSYTRPAFLKDAGAISQDTLSMEATASTESAGNASANSVLSHATQTWQELPVGDLEALTAALRAQGYPPHIVRGIIGHHLNLEYDERRKALRDGEAISPYWRQSVFAAYGNANLRSELRALNREMAERLGELTGTQATLYAESQLHTLRQRYGNLPADTLEAIMAIEQDYSELNREVREASQGALFRSDREKIALLEEEKKKDLLSVLTLEQYEELQLRSSPTGHRLRTTLAVMEPTEQEFRTIFHREKEFEDRFSSTSVNVNTPAFREERRLAEQALIAAVKADLGPERAEAYEKSRDPSYVHAHTVAKQLNLPLDAGDRLYALQKDAFQEFSKLASAPGMNTEQRQAAQRALVQEKAAALTAIVGESNLATYRGGMGSWLTMLEETANRGTGGGTIQIYAPPIQLPSP